MPNPNAVVSTVLRFEPPLDRPPAELLRADPGVSVELEGERRVRLDPSDERSIGFAQVLDGLRKLRLPVYLEVDPETSAIARLLIPHVARVVGVRPMDDGALGVELTPSHAVHVLPRGAEDFEELQRSLTAAQETGAPTIVTENDAHEIVDVREYTPDPDGPPLPLPKPEPLTPRSWPWRLIELPLWIWWWPWWPWWWLRCISQTRAQEVFDAMKATSCNPTTVPPPCIPFLYPDDGCWARAHEMCRLMIGMGLRPRKVWISGSLHVATRNNPACAVGWGWHVAPTLCVRGPRLLQKQYMVIDPSLFTTPVSKSAWKGVQGDPSATLTDTDASDYLWGTPDPNYVDCNQKLAYYRLQLQNRSNQVGPPPYANCS